MLLYALRMCSSGVSKFVIIWARGVMSILKCHDIQIFSQSAIFITEVKEDSSSAAALPVSASLYNGTPMGAADGLYTP